MINFSFFLIYYGITNNSNKADYFRWLNILELLFLVEAFINTMTYISQWHINSLYLKYTFIFRSLCKSIELFIHSLNYLTVFFRQTLYKNKHIFDKHFYIQLDYINSNKQSKLLQVLDSNFYLQWKKWHFYFKFLFNILSIYLEFFFFVWATHYLSFVFILTWNWKEKVFEICDTTIKGHQNEP